jgi:hypothetical protein
MHRSRTTAFIPAALTPACASHHNSDTAHTMPQGTHDRQIFRLSGLSRWRGLHGEHIGLDLGISSLRCQLVWPPGRWEGQRSDTSDWRLSHFEPCMCRLCALSFALVLFWSLSGPFCCRADSATARSAELHTSCTCTRQTHNRLNLGLGLELLSVVLPHCRPDLPKF